jgi:hypothetical protein
MSILFILPGELLPVFPELFLSGIYFTPFKSGNYATHTHNCVSLYVYNVSNFVHLNSMNFMKEKHDNKQLSDKQEKL